MATQLPKSRQEGHLLVLTAVIVGAALHYYVHPLAATPLWVGAAALLYLFRDPERLIPCKPNAALSPVDGKVLAVEPCQDPYIDRDAICVRMRMHRLGAYTIRSPIEGRIQQRWFAGINGEAVEGGNKERRRFASTWIQSNIGNDIIIAMSKGSLWEAPRCFVSSGERVGQGRRCGYFRFGSEVDVFLPTDSQVQVQPGDDLMAGQDVLAVLPKV